MNFVAVVVLAQLAVPARAQAPILAFPQPGVDDVAAYQGYQTRFYKDAAGNTVQIYIDQKTGRVVHLLADAENESVGFTARDSRNQPAELRWDPSNAQVSASGRNRSLAYTLHTNGPELHLGWFVLGSMRIERDFQYQGRHRTPFSGPAFSLPEFDGLVRSLRRLEPAERRRHLAALNAPDLNTLAGRFQPRVTRRAAASNVTVRVSQPSIDGRDSLFVEFVVDPTLATTTLAARDVTVRAKPGAPDISVLVRITTTGASLTPLARSEIFNSDFLAFLARSDTSTPRGRWLERQVRGVELLSSREKLMAGLPAYATYFGRDMLLSALMMRSIWREEMSAFVIASALRKLSPAGEVSHEEALGGQAAREAAAEYTRLVDDYATAARRGERALARQALESARSVLVNARRVRENYHMIDDEFQLPVLAARWLTSPDVLPGAKQAFLLGSEGGRSRVELLLREFALVARMTSAYARDPQALNLVSFPRRDSTTWSSASWRDSGAGYAGGRFAMDVNAIWAPHALESIQSVLGILPTLGFPLDSLARALPEMASGTPLGTYVRDAATLSRAIATWWDAGRHFLVTLGPDQVQSRVRARLDALAPDERRYWTSSLNTSHADADSLQFLALSLDGQGRPIPVANTDPATRLFLEDRANRPVASVQSDALRDVRLFVRTYPVGLFVDRVGPVVANDAYAPSTIWPVFERDRYHGPRVVWGREVNLFLLGAANHVASADATGGAYVSELRAAMARVMAAVEASGFHSELWSYEVQNGTVVPIRYGSGSDVQLWSTTDLAVQFALDRLK